MRLLLAEDEIKVAEHIRAAFREQGFCVDMFHRGDDALGAALITKYDAVVLDVMLPGQDGIGILKVLREKKYPAPILLLTARGEVSARVEGLMLGADDYVAKPFAMSELVARVVALTRRSTAQGQMELRVADLSLNQSRREVRRGGRVLDLPVREYGLLEVLMRAPGKVVTKTQLIEHVWEWSQEIGANALEAYMQRLRKIIDSGFEEKLVRTIRGVGYAIKEGE